MPNYRESRTRCLPQAIKSRSGFWASLTFLALLAWMPLASVTAADLRGERVQWYPLALDFYGPQTSESSDSPNPFLDYRLNVVMTSPSGNTRTVPGFYAGDGNGGSSGNVWRARFTVDEAGTWRYRADFRQGSEIAVSLDANAGTPNSFHGDSGEFTVSGMRSDAPGFQRWGRLQYTTDHYMKFSDGPYWIKTGTDSPENFLAFAGFDGTTDLGGARSNFLHRYEPHINDWQNGDPYFVSDRGVDSRGIIGALNYLSSQSVNSIYFLPMNLGGDGYDTHPFLAPERTRYHKTHFDLSKLEQWNTVLLHAQQRGIALNIVLNETELENRNWQDDGQFGVERQLYYREMIARFGYLLAAKWNICEENNFTVDFVREAAAYINALDWTDKAVSVHTPPDRFENYYELLGNPLITATSIQYSIDRAGEYVEQWRERSRSAGVPWIIDMDENDRGLLDNNATDMRKRVLYDVLFSGGNIEWYFGFGGPPLGGDVTLEDFRTRESMWTWSRHARNFMQDALPFWRMQPADSLVSGENGDFGGAEVLASIGDLYAIYLPNASGNPGLSLAGESRRWEVRWFNPESGQYEGESRTVEADGYVSLGSAPSRNNSDWVVLVRRADGNTTPVNPQSDNTDNTNNTDNNQQPSQPQTDNNNQEEYSATAGQTINIVVRPDLIDGRVPGMYIENPPNGSSFDDNRNGSRTFSWTPDSSSTGLTEIVVSIEALEGRRTMTLSINVGGGSSINDDSGDNTNNDSTTPDSSLSLELPQRLDVSVGNTLELRVAPASGNGSIPSVSIENLPAGAEFADNFDGTRSLRWVPSEGQTGSYTLRITVRDASDSAVTLIRSLEVQVNG